METAPISAEPAPPFWLTVRRPFAMLALAGHRLDRCFYRFVIRARMKEGLDNWLANESVAGRRRECPDRLDRAIPSALSRLRTGGSRKAAIQWLGGQAHTAGQVSAAYTSRSSKRRCGSRRRG